MRVVGIMCFIISKENNYLFLKMKLGWMLKLLNYCIVILGKMLNELYFVIRILNVGKNRKLGFRLIVRGVVKNFVDYLYGGGEGIGLLFKVYKMLYGKLIKLLIINKKF